MDNCKNNIDDKKAYYSDSKVVKEYDDLRFGNPGGQYVHRCESVAFKKLLGWSEDRRSVLDIPTGTGRMLPLIRSLGFSTLLAADYSKAMIRQCQANPDLLGIGFSRQDIYDTTYPNGCFSAILCSRFFFIATHKIDYFKSFPGFCGLAVPSYSTLWSGPRELGQGYGPRSLVAISTPIAEKVSNNWLSSTVSNW